MKNKFVNILLKIHELLNRTEIYEYILKIKMDNYDHKLERLEIEENDLFLIFDCGLFACSINIYYNNIDDDLSRRIISILHEYSITNKIHTIKLIDSPTQPYTVYHIKIVQKDENNITPLLYNIVFKGNIKNITNELLEKSCNLMFSILNKEL